jgi:hypothetical protein
MFVRISSSGEIIVAARILAVEPAIEGLMMSVEKGRSVDLCRRFLIDS